MEANSRRSEPLSIAKCEIGVSSSRFGGLNALLK